MDEKQLKARNYLNMLIAEYASIGPSGMLGLNLVLLPLKKRFDEEEFSDELYEEIMSCT